MFTGLIEEVGTLTHSKTINGGKRLLVSAQKILDSTRVDDSIAVNGVCLTVTELTAGGFWVDAVGETLNKTTIKNWRLGQKVNLERALRLSDRLGGHLVQGHVNAVGRTTRLEKMGENYWWEVEVPQTLMKYVIAEGSIALDGISLTVARLNGNRVGLSIIPHTYRHTALRFHQVGAMVNVEVDVIARYVERLLQFDNKNGGTGGLSEDWLKRMGF
ncbi:riboflavin synthase [Calditrichota bacterium LG25]